MRPSHSIRHPFTLVELLVVVAIISVLAALLLPALVRARTMAKLVACKSQMKQVGAANQMYVDDSEDFLPPIYGGSGALIRGWNGTTQPYGYWGLGTLQQQGYLSWELILRCPGRDTPGSNSQYGYGVYSSTFATMPVTPPSTDPNAYDRTAFHRSNAPKFNYYMGHYGVFCGSALPRWAPEAHESGVSWPVHQLKRCRANASP